MAMNADLLAAGSNVFYLRGTTGEHVPATVVGLSSFPECVAISYDDEVLGVEWAIVACQPLRPPRPCPKRLCSTPVSDTSTPLPLCGPLSEKTPSWREGKDKAFVHKQAKFHQRTFFKMRFFD